MNKQLAKIEEFMNSVECSQMTDGQQSLVLASSVNVIGGSNTGSQCTNYEVECCSGVNTRCTNYGVCDTSDNTKSCSNKPVPFTPNPGDIYSNYVANCIELLYKHLSQQQI